jgi:hypothetical protein
MTDDTPKRPPGRPRKRPKREPSYKRPYAAPDSVKRLITLTATTDAKLDDLASESGMSRSAVVRMLIDEA